MLNLDTHICCICEGESKAVPGNENIIMGFRVCDLVC
jgi:hypothetical protein